MACRAPWIGAHPGYLAPFGRGVAFLQVTRAAALAFLGRTVVVTCSLSIHRAGHRPWDRAATTAQSGPGHDPGGEEKTPPGLWPGLAARLADAGQLSGAMLVPAAVTAASTLALLPKPMVRCSSPGPPWVWPSARRPAALSAAWSGLRPRRRPTPGAVTRSAGDGCLATRPSSNAGGQSGRCNAGNVGGAVR